MRPDLRFEPNKQLASVLRHPGAERKWSIMNNGHELYLDGDSLYAVTPEGNCRSMPLELLFDKIAATNASLNGVIPPKGVIREWALGNVVIWLYEREPQPYNFKWIARDSASRFGRGTKYREVSITLPYLLVFAVFASVAPGRLSLTAANEAYFRNRPVTSPDDEICFPALLNCSKFPAGSGRPLSWICTQYFDRGFDREADLNQRMRGALKSLLRCLLESGFNYSSEHHEGASWFTESRHVDDRISTIEKWEAASKADPLFVLDVPWLKTGLTVSRVVERIFKNLNATRPKLKTAGDVARLIHNQKPPAPPPDPALLI
jgi:hypothetical protein